MAVTLVSGVALALLSVSASSLLVDRIGAQGVTAIFFIIAVLGPLIGTLDGRLARRASVRARLMGQLVIVGLACLAIGITESSIGTFAVVAVIVGSIYEIMTLTFDAQVFNLAGERFDVRQSKRLLGLVITGRWMAAFVTGLVVIMIGGHVSVGALLLAAGGFMFLGAFVTWLAGRQKPVVPDTPTPVDVTHGAAIQPSATSDALDSDSADGQPPSVRDLLSFPLVRLVGVLVACMFGISLIADFMLIEQAEAAIPVGRLAMVFAIIESIEGALLVLATLIGSGPVLRRFGPAGSIRLCAVIMVVPLIGLVVTVAAGMTGPAFVMAASLRASERLTRRAIGSPAISVLLQPLGERVAEAARTMLTTTWVTLHQGPIAIAAGAVLLLSLGPPILAGAGLLYAVTQIVLTARTRSAYRDVLRTALDRRRLGADFTIDADIRGLLLQRLGDPNPLRALAAATLVTGEPVDAAEALPHLLTHPVAEVRLHGITVARRLDLPIDEAQMRRMVTCAVEQDTSLLLTRRALVLAVERGFSWAVDLARERMAAGYVDGALALLAGDGEERDRAHTALANLAAESEPRLRATAGTALASIASDESRGLLVGLLADTDPFVSSATARELVRTGGLRAKTALDAALHGPLEPAVRRRLLRALVELDEGRASKMALAVVDDTDAATRTLAWELVGNAATSTSEGLGGALASQTVRLNRIMTVASSSSSPLWEALQLAVRRERIALAHAMRPFGGVREGAMLARSLDSADMGRIASAIELVDATVTPQARRHVHLFDDPIAGPTPDGTRQWPSAHPVPDRWVGLITSEDAGHTDGIDIALTLLERTVALRAAPIFAETPPEVVVDLANRAVMTRLAAGTTLFEEGAPGTSLFVVVDGAISIRAGDVELNHIESGAAFGELAILDPESRSASAVAATDCLLLELDAAVFAEVLEDRPEVARSVMRYLARRLRRSTLAASGRAYPDGSHPTVPPPPPTA